MKNLLAQTINAKRLAYPTITPTIRSALYHLFLVIGNGYEWDKDGNLTDADMRDHNNRYQKAFEMTQNGVIAKWLVYEEPIPDPQWESERQRMRELIAKAELSYLKGCAVAGIEPEPFEKNVHENTLLDPNNVNFTWFPMCEYSRALSIPKKAPMFWRRAVLGTMRLVIKDAQEDRHIFLSEYQQDLQHNVKWAQKAIKRIEAFR